VFIWYCGAECFSKMISTRECINFLYINTSKSLENTKKNKYLIFFETKHTFKMYLNTIKKMLEPHKLYP